MKPIEKIREILKGITDAKISDNGNLIALLTDEPNGYDVTFEEQEKRYVVSFGQWHEFLKKNQAGEKLAIELFRLGLSDACRLKLYSRGELTYKCILEFKDSKTGNWVIGEKSSPLLYSFWSIKGSKVQTFQNHFIHDSKFGDAYALIKADRKQTSYKIGYTCAWLLLFFSLNGFNLFKAFTSLLFAYPIAIVTLLVPLIVIGNRFQERSYGKKSKAKLTGKERRLLFIWISIWVSAILLSYFILSPEVFFTLLFFLFPFGLAGFFVPIWNFQQKNKKRKNG